MTVERHDLLNPKLAVRWAVLGVAYYVLAMVGFRLALPGTSATVIWLPTGVAIACVLRFGPSVWPGILVAAFLSNVHLLAGNGLPTGTNLMASLGAGVGNTLEALIPGYLLTRFTRTRDPFDEVRHVLQYLAFGAILAPLVSALIGTTTYIAVTSQWHLWRQMAATWWLGDATGALVMAPLMLAFWKDDWRDFPWAIHRDAVLAGALVLAFWFGLCPLLPPLAFLFLPLLVLGTFRLGRFYAHALVTLLALLATVSTVLGQGPFLLAGSRFHSLLLQQGFLGTLAVTALVLAAALQERRALEDRLLSQNRLYRTLTGINQAMVHSSDRNKLEREACRFLVEVGGFRMAWVGFKDEASGRVLVEAAAGAGTDYLRDAVIRWDDSPEGQGPTGQALRLGQGAVFRDCLHDPRFAPWRAAAEARGYQTSCAFPIRQGGQVTGVLTAYHAEADAVGTEEIRLLEELASDLGFAFTAMETRMDLVESERRFRSTLENVKLLALSLAEDGSITFCNDFMLALTGWQRNEVLGRNVFDLFLPEDIRPSVAAWFASSNQFGPDPLHNENEILTRTGERRLVRWNNTTLRDREGRTMGTVSLGEDITEQKRNEAELQQRAAQLTQLNARAERLYQDLQAHADQLEQRVEERTARLREANQVLARSVEKAEAADRAKSAFLSAMSHELRTPLNSVIGFTGVLLGGMAGPLQPRQEEPLRIVQRNGRHLLDLINDVLDLSKVEAAEMRLASQPFDLVEVVRETLDTLAPVARSKGLGLRAHLTLDRLPLVGDRRRVAQILLNLGSNAIKFTEEGAVTVGVVLEGGMVRVAVTDTGPGIADKDLPRLFREFEQLDTGLARRSEGTGLGLALSRRLAWLLKGDIEVQSRLGQGSTFSLLLPVDASVETP